MAESVTSPNNPKLKLVRKLATRRGRSKEAAFAVQGEDLVLAGVAAGWKLKFALVAESAVLELGAREVLDRYNLLDVADELIADLSDLAHPARVIGVFDTVRPVGFIDTSVTLGAALYLGGVRDPGNIGTALRSAAALGASRVALGPGSADPFSPKASRASMGAVFTAPWQMVADLPTFVEKLDAARPHAPHWGPVVAFDPHAELSIFDVNLGPRPVLCLGAEREGIDEDIVASADMTVSIPQTDGVESLNVAASVAIALYEWRRQQGAE